MASLDNQQPWIPYEATKDCSQGFCSIYCPQWCYIIFPPPPPFALSDDDPSSGAAAAAFSPLVISIIAIIAAALLLVSYYTIISKYCGNLGSSIRHLSSPPAPGVEGRSRHHDVGAWHVSPSNGLDEALISMITVYRYRRGEGLISGADCSVCLAEFREDESLRLLPKCSHAFHLRCIDTWLKSHSNCPLCRADIVLTENPVRLQLLENDRPIGEGGRSDEVAVVIEDVESNLENECDASKDPTVSPCDSFGIRRSFSMDSCNHGRVSISDVLKMSMEDEFLVAKDHGLVAGSGSSRRQEGRSPVPMKRSVSGGRICFTRN